MGTVSTKLVLKFFEDTSDVLFIRSDIRDYKNIFDFGFQPRSVSYEKYIKNKSKIIGPTLRKKIMSFSNEKAEYDFDFDPATGICVSRNFDATLLFPIPESDTYHPRTWVYFVRSKTAYATYKNQAHPDAKNYVAEEACRDIPPGDIIAAVECERYISDDHNQIYYRIISDLKWNQNAIGINQTKQTKVLQKEIQGIFNERVGKFVKSYQHHQTSDYTFSDSIEDIITKNDVCSFGRYLCSKQKHNSTDLTIILKEAFEKGRITIAKLLLLNGADQSILSDKDWESLGLPEEEQKNYRYDQEKMDQHHEIKKHLKKSSLILSHQSKLIYQNRQPTKNKKHSTEPTIAPSSMLFVKNIKISKREMAESAFGKACVKRWSKRP